MSETEKRKREGKGDFVSDPRFARLHTDARFQVFPNKQRKVEIDERFKGRPVLAHGLRISGSSIKSWLGSNNIIILGFFLIIL